MANSLVVTAGAFTADLMSPTSAFRVGEGHDFADAEVITALVQDDDTDGALVVGERAGNRTVTLPLSVRAPSRALISTYVSQLRQALNTATFTLTWTPDGGLPTVWDCFRATVKTTWSTKTDQRWMQLEATFQALPYGRTGTPVSLNTDSATPSQIDSLDTASGYTITGGTGATSDTTNFTQGTASLRFTPTYPGAPSPASSFTVTKTISSFNLVDKNLDVAIDMLYANPNEARINDTLAFTSLTLFSASGTRTYTAWSGYALNDGGWATNYFHGTYGTSETGTFDATAVTSYSLTGSLGSNQHPGAGISVNIDNLRVARTSGSGGVYRFGSVQGDARAPLALTVTCQASRPFTRLLIHRAPARLPGFNPVFTNPGTATTSYSVTLPAYLYRGQFAVLAVAPAAGTAQVSFSDGTSIVTLTKTVSGADADGFAEFGFVSLPPVDVDPTNTAANITLSVTPGSGGISAIVLLDTAGEAVVLQNMPNIYRVWVDPPGPGQPLPRITGSTNSTPARSTAISLTPYLAGSMHPFLVPGSDNTVTIVGYNGTFTSTPTLTGTYYPRWLAERAT